MKINIKPAITKILRLASIIIASAYLTFLVDTYTLNTVWKRVFVFGYFLVMCAIFVYLKERFTKKRNSISETILSAVITVMILAVFQNVFLPTARSNTITLQAGETGEVWLISAEVDNREVPLSDISIKDNVNWMYVSEYDDYVYYPNSDSYNSLTVDIWGNEIKLNFAANSWSGVVSITGEGGKTESLVLYTEGDVSGRIEYQMTDKQSRSNFEKAVFNFGAGIIIWSILFVLLTWLPIDALYTKLTQYINIIKNIKKWRRGPNGYPLYLYIFVIIWRIILMNSFEHYIMYPDSVGYLDYPWSDFFQLNITNGRTPIYPAFLAGMRIVFGEERLLYIVPVVQAIIALVSLLFLYKALFILTRNVLISSLVTTLYGINPDIIVWDSSILTESLALSLTIVFLYLVIRFIDLPSLKIGIAAILLTFLMIFERPTFLLFAGLLFAFWILRALKNKKERKMLCVLCVVSLLTFLAVIIYAYNFEKNFGYMSISDALPRQNLYTAITRGYYLDSPNSEFIEAVNLALKDNPDNAWSAMSVVLGEFGQAESNKLALEVFYGNPVRYAGDTIYGMLSDSVYGFAEGYIYTAFYSTLETRSIFSALINAIRSILELRIIWLYIFGVVEIWALIKKRRDSKKMWIHLGLMTFMLLIPISTYIATCGEYSRTMIHVVPFVYISIAMALADYFAPKAVCQNKQCISGEGGEN